MNGMAAALKEKFLEVIKATAPLIVVVCVLQFSVVNAPMALFLQFLAGSILVVIGMMVFFMGIDLGILSMGNFIGAELPQKGSLTLILGVAFSLGFVTTVAEPDVLVLADQIDAISHGTIAGDTIKYAMAVGVGFCVALAMLRIILGISMTYLLLVAYGLVIVLSLSAPADFIPLAFDAGSVTTGALTAPVVLSLALGLSSVLAGRTAVSDGFGLLGFASIGPILTVLFLGLVR